MIGLAVVAMAVKIWTIRHVDDPARQAQTLATADKVVPSATPDKPLPMASSTPIAPPTISQSVLTEDEKGRVARALSSGRLEMPANIAVLRGRTGPLPGADDPTPAFSPTAPVRTAVIEARPQFSWTAKAGSTRYSVTVFDERFREVAKSGSLRLFEISQGQ